MFIIRKIKYCQNVSSFQLIYRCNAISIKKNSKVFVGIKEKKPIPKSIWRNKRPIIVNPNIGEE